MSEHVYWFSALLLFGSILAIFAMKYVSAAMQARTRVASDNAYRALAERAVAAQGEQTAALAAVTSALTEAVARLGAVEKILKEVE
jgi:HAMP domain-containing protein